MICLDGKVRLKSCRFLYNIFPAGLLSYSETSSPAVMVEAVIFAFLRWQNGFKHYTLIIKRNTKKNLHKWAVALVISETYVMPHANIADFFSHY